MPFARVLLSIVAGFFFTGLCFGDDANDRASGKAAEPSTSDERFEDHWKQPDGPLQTGWRVTHDDHPDWWDPLEIRNGSPVNIDPDKGKIVQPENSGARCSAWREFGESSGDNVSVSVEWNGDHRAVGFPIVCINRDEPDFGLAFCYEPNIAGGAWVLWALGRRPDQIRVLKGAGGRKHIDREKLVLEMRVHGKEVTCLADGDEILTSEIPPAHVGSTIHGFGIDVNPVPGRPADFPVLSGPFVLKKE